MKKDVQKILLQCKAFFLQNRNSWIFITNMFSPLELIQNTITKLLCKPRRSQPSFVVLRLNWLLICTTFILPGAMTLGLFCPEAVGPCKVVVVPSDGLILVLGGILSYLRAPEADAPAARVGVNEPDGWLFFLSCCITTTSTPKSSFMESVGVLLGGRTP